MYTSTTLWSLAIYLICKCVYFMEYNTLHCLRGQWMYKMENILYLIWNLALNLTVSLFVVVRSFGMQHIRIFFFFHIACITKGEKSSGGQCIETTMSSYNNWDQSDKRKRLGPISTKRPSATCARNFHKRKYKNAQTRFRGLFV